MQTQDIIYQHSPQFLPKISIKLENLIASLIEAKNETHPIIHHYALKNLVEILKIIDKPELKSRLTKEFLRLNYVLPKSFSEKAPVLAQQFELKIHELQTQSGRFASQLHQDPFLQSLKLRSQDQWQECELQPPYLFNWLHQKSKVRQEMIATWLNELHDLKSVIHIYLSVLRQLVQFETLEITHSFYQKPVMANPSCQLIIIKLAHEIPVIPKIQLSTHALSIHFSDIENFDKPANHKFQIELGMVRI
jgi:cell division protein ZapD